jgi:hypothetical protein
MSLWHKFWDFLDNLSDRAIIAICLILIAWYAIRTNRAPLFTAPGFASAKQEFSVRVVQALPRLSLCPLRMFK